MRRTFLFFILAFGCSIGTVKAQSFKADVATLIETSCIGCHDADTETSLNFETLGYNLSDRETFQRWERIFDRVHKGEMPPESEERPDEKLVTTALNSLRDVLRTESLTRQERAGRVPARRLTKLEFGYTLRDLLLIDRDVTSGIPEEVRSGSFDTVGANQRLSAVHLESYLEAVDEALELAINLEKNPYRHQKMDFVNSEFLNSFHHKPLNLGGSISRKIEDGVALFRDVDYLITSFAGGFDGRSPGTYRITSTVAAYQSKEPITFKLIRKEPSGSAQLLATHDLVPGKNETVTVSTWLNPGDTFYSTFQMKDEPFAGIAAAGGSKNYKGPGIAIKAQQVEGPLSESWPPPSTRQLFRSFKIVATNDSGNGPFKIERLRGHLGEVDEIVREIAPRILRRPASAGEIKPFVDLAQPAIDASRDFIDALNIPLRSMLTSPQFLLFGGEAGELDDYSLASRLSYFLWKSMPDEELFTLAETDKLSDPKVLAQQVDRMLADEKSKRFVTDFLGQWLRLYEIDATSPDAKLYPEFDELLGDAVSKEPELFFEELIRKNLSITNFVDSKFTFVNRRLAEHYGISEIQGQHFRKVDLPDESPRGGVLTQSAILKTTANGTTTSPVMRGNFVLTSILGTPPSPPPPSVGSIEPDTRGKTTIREILDAHRNTETCAKCHREIDPPGFALESFDPIGGFRTSYRATGPGLLGFLSGSAYHDGPRVDPSGVTRNGKKFSGIAEFKQLLLEEKEQIARNFASRLVVYSTGGEIQFADREEVEAILERTRDNDFRIRDIIHEVVQSRLFRNK